jgi:hypothetical protein
MWPTEQQVKDAADGLRTGLPMFNDDTEIDYYIRNLARPEGAAVAIQHELCDYLRRERIGNPAHRPGDSPQRKRAKAALWALIDRRLARWARVFARRHGWPPRTARGLALARVAEETGLKRTVLDKHRFWRADYLRPDWPEETVSGTTPPRPRPEAQDQALIDQLTADFIGR